MEITKQFNGRIKRYLRRREYKRLHAEIADQKRPKVARFHGGGEPRRRFWKIRIARKLRWKIFSPLKLLTSLKNAYVKMMLGLAGNVGALNNDNKFGNKRIPKARQARIVYSAEEIEDRLVYEIYMALKASGDPSAAPAPAPAPAPGPGPAVIPLLLL